MTLADTQTEIAPGADYWPASPPPSPAEPLAGSSAPGRRFANQTAGLIALLIGTAILYLSNLGASGYANDY